MKNILSALFIVWWCTMLPDILSSRDIPEMLGRLIGTLLITLLPAMLLMRSSEKESKRKTGNSANEQPVTTFRKVRKIIGKTLLVLGIILVSFGIITDLIFGTPQQRAERWHERAAFKESIQRADKDCPIPVAMGHGAVAGIRLEGDYLTYYLAFDSLIGSPVTKMFDNEKMKAGYVLIFSAINAQGGNKGDVFMKELIKLEYGIRIMINGEAMCVISPDEVKDLWEKHDYDPHEAVYNMMVISLEMGGVTFPVALDESTIWTSVELEGENIVLTYDVDEDIFSIDEFNTDKEKAAVMKEGIMEGLLNSIDNSFLDMFKVSHTGLIYRWYGDRSHKEFEIRIPSYEIQYRVPTPDGLNIQ